LFSVIPAKAGIQYLWAFFWIPAFKLWKNLSKKSKFDVTFSKFHAGMTDKRLIFHNIFIAIFVPTLNTKEPNFFAIRKGESYCQKSNIF
jgi:hypothetical protein